MSLLLLTLTIHVIKVTVNVSLSQQFQYCRTLWPEIFPSLGKRKLGLKDGMEYSSETEGEVTKLATGDITHCYYIFLFSQPYHIALDSLLTACKTLSANDRIELQTRLVEFQRDIGDKIKTSWVVTSEFCPVYMFGRLGLIDWKIFVYFFTG